MPYYAHSDGKVNTDEWQLLSEHLINTAKLAEKNASKFRSDTLGFWCGILHDIGKYSDEFQKRLSNSKVFAEHSSASAQLLKSLGEQNPKLKQLWKAMAYITAGHHSGLLDWNSANDTCLDSRLRKTIPDYSAWKNDICLPQDLSLPSFNWQKSDKKLVSFQFAFLIRMLYSCLVDADFLDTENYMEPSKSLIRNKVLPSLASLRDKLTTYLEEKIKAADKTEINHARKEILEQCLKKADIPQGLFTLTVPTGGGKTLSSLAFALDHALKHNLERIIYVIPYTSIIEQNASIFREILGDAAVVEHHCNYEIPEEKITEDEGNPFQRLILATENWAAPLIVTTNVQFFESLFANRSSRCRKLHNLCRSVIILDEAQLMNPEFLTPSLKALEELVRNYKTSVLLCTATQPNLNNLYSPDIKPVELMENPISLYQQFKRVVVKAPDTEPLLDDVLVQELSKYDQVLCIVNTRRHASTLYAKLSQLQPEGTYHLSARMYPRHRSNKLREIREALKSNQLCQVVSTQLVEAGVDLDFSVVYRSMTGLDSIAQAAGRCNREGKREYGLVRLFRPENGQPKGWFSRIADIADIMSRKHPEDLLALPAISDYFAYLYSRNEELDKKEIYQIYENIEYPFQNIADAFQWIENNTIPIIIPKEECLEIIHKIEKYPQLPIPYRKLQQYTVQVYLFELQQYKTMQAIDVIDERYYFLRPECVEQYYDPQYGLKYPDNISKQDEYYIV
ncbi:MAG: CRISPR-associated helicase Cas3' [bacterium]